MENMTKALIIAAAMIGVVLILSILMLGYNKISAHYKNEHDLAMIEQTEEFNKRFENYHRKGVRGNDIISLMNRIIDYNASQSYQDETKYPRIRVTIEIGEDKLKKDFKYHPDDECEYLDSTITNTNASGDFYKDDKELIKVTGIPSMLIEKYRFPRLTLTETILQKLSAEISNIRVSDTDESSGSIKTRFKRAEILERVLGLKVGIEETDDIKIDLEYAITTTTDRGYSYIEKAKEIATQYYQYTQFKRAKFDCTEVKYDKETGRVVEMNFVVQTNASNRVVFE